MKRLSKLFGTKWISPARCWARNTPRTARCCRRARARGTASAQVRIDPDVRHAQGGVALVAVVHEHAGIRLVVSVKAIKTILTTSKRRLLLLANTAAQFSLLRR